MYFYALISPCENGMYLMGKVVSNLGELNLSQAKGSYLAMLGFGDIRRDTLHLLDIREIVYGGRLGGRPSPLMIVANGMNN